MSVIYFDIRLDMSNTRQKHGEGRFGKIIRDVYNVKFEKYLLHLMRTYSNGHLAEQITCAKSSTPAYSKIRERNPDGFKFRCKGSKHDFWTPHLRV